jgi:pilus assembly protein Flp/PilA
MAPAVEREGCTWTVAAQISATLDAYWWSALSVRAVAVADFFEITTMRSIAENTWRFLDSEDGPTAVEYAVMLALIVIVCLTAIQAIGTNARNTSFDVEIWLAS